MRKSIPVAEVLRRVMDDTDDEFASSDKETVGDMKVGDDQLVWEDPKARFGARSDVDPCLLDSALLNDDEVGEVNIEIFFLVFFCVKCLIIVQYKYCDCVY